MSVPFSTPTLTRAMTRSLLVVRTSRVRDRDVGSDHRLRVDECDRSLRPNQGRLTTCSGRGQPLRANPPTIFRVLFTPARHEPLAGRRFSEAAAREAIARIAVRTERDLDAADGRWPLDPADAEHEGEGPGSGVFYGAAGVAWALDELAAEGYVAPGLIDRELVEALEARLLADPDDPDLGVEGVWTGVAGVLAVAEHRWPDPARRDRLADLARASLASPALEPMYGHPGHMVLAAQLHARTAEERWAALWSAGAERLLREWRHDDALGAWLWTQRLGTKENCYVGAAHGLVGNVHVLLRGGALLPAGQRDEVERRAVET